MQQTELFQNIKDARAQLSKLKQEAQALQSDPFGTSNQNSNMNDYMKSVAYSLTKNQQTIQKKLIEYGDDKNRQKIERNRLPSINGKTKEQKSEHDLSLMQARSAYRKHRKQFKHPSQQKKQKTDQQSTKIDNSLSLSVQNRPMKIHSNHEKNIKPQISIEYEAHPNQVPLEILKLKQQAFRLQNESRIKNSRNKSFHNISGRRSNPIKYLDLNSSSNIQQNSVLNPPNQMQYSGIVDKYSKHQFMIINGKFVNQGPQYASFSRIYASILSKIRIQINKLEGMLNQNNIRYARFDGKKLAFLCLKDEISKSELVDCIIDEKNQIKNILLPSNKFLGLVGQVFAATKIQSFLRMNDTRAKFLLLKKKTIILQGFFRRNLQKLQLERKIRERNSNILKRFEERQQQLQEQWKTIKKGKRIEIHLNNMEIDEEKRLSIQNFGQRQNIQLSRIFRLKDQNLIIIYISSSQLSPQVVNYYYKMLELANIPKYQDRLIFMSPNQKQRFPEHFSVSKLLYYSSKTLKQLKIITEDLPTLLFPGHPSNQLIKICDYLNCYLFSGSPQNIKSFTAKSQAIRFFRNLSLQTLPSAMQMYDYGQFLNTFAVQITKNPQIKTWVLKIDDQFGGRGIAYLQIGRSKIIQSYLKRIQNQANDEFFTTDAPGDSDNQQIIIKIRDYLKGNLSQRLKIATPSLYRCYEQFMGKFIKKGGIIEAKPPYSQNKGTYSYPSVSFCLSPHGEYQIITTYEKIIGSPYRSYACTFPQKCLQIKQFTPILTRICQSFKLRKIFGIFTVDFIHYKEHQSSSKKQFQRLWILGIDPYINNYTASYYLFDVLMGGSYFPEQNSYFVEEDQDNEKMDQISIQTMSSDGIQQPPISQRSYVFVPHFHNQNLFKIKIKQFFKQARIQRFNFDVANKQGLCVLLLDQLTSGIMSMMGIGRYQEQQIDLLKRVMQFIVKMTQVKNVTYGGTDLEPTTDRIPVKDITSLFTSLVRKRQRIGAKQKAVKKFNNNCNLQFIS